MKSIPDFPTETNHHGAMLQQATIALMRRLASSEGWTSSALDGVHFLRVSQSGPVGPVVCPPGIVVICQGLQRGYIGELAYACHEQHFLAVPVPTPLTIEVDAHAEAPLFAIHLDLDIALVAELMLQLAQHGGVEEAASATIAPGPMGQWVGETVLRLLKAMTDPSQVAVLGRALVRELYYHVLVDARGGALRSAVAPAKRYAEISHAIGYIHAHYASGLTIEDLAQEAGMSVSNFFSHFRHVTRTSPIQYLKLLRLNQARVLMARDGMSVAAACYKVGYSSPAHFSREFKRLFGRSPADEIRRLKEELTTVPAAFPGASLRAP